VTPICTESFAGWGFDTGTTGRAYSALPDPLAVFRGARSKGTGGEGRGRERRE